MALPDFLNIPYFTPMLLNELLFPVILVVIMFVTAWSGKLTLPATFLGGVITTVIYCGTGYPGIAFLAAFFLLGTIATSWKMDFKQRLGLAERNRGQRSAGQVAANALMAAVAACIACIWTSYRPLATIAAAACFSAATADTLSSELGMIYGSKYFNVISFKEDKCGADGVISIEGTLIGLAGSAVIAAIFSLFYSWNLDCWWIIVAGTAGNAADSFMGAIWERKQKIGNNTVNFLNTLVAVVTALLLHQLLSLGFNV